MGTSGTAAVDILLGFSFGFFLIRKVVTAGKLFYDWARCNRDEYARKNRTEDMTHTQKATPRLPLWDFIFI